MSIPRSRPQLSLLSFAAFSIAALTYYPVQSQTADPGDAGAGAGKARIILISCDGTRPDAIAALGEERLPNFFRLRREGAFTDNARTDYTYTVTLPNHTSMITSRGVAGETGHAWIKNTDPTLGESLHSNRRDYVSSVFAVAHDNGLRTGLFASKSKFSLYDFSYNAGNGAEDETGEDNGRDKIDVFHGEPDTGKLVDAMLDEMKKAPMDFIMLHLRNPDSAGHAAGWTLDPDSEYMKSIESLDPLFGKLLDAIDTLPDYQGRTYLIVTADHGGWRDTKGHGEADQKDNYTIPFYVWGPGIPAGAELYSLNADSRQDPGEDRPDYEATGQPIRNGDAGNLALKLLGLPAIPGSTINVAQDLSVTVSAVAATSPKASPKD